MRRYEITEENKMNCLLNFDVLDLLVSPPLSLSLSFSLQYSKTVHCHHRSGSIISVAAVGVLGVVFGEDTQTCSKGQSH